MKYPAHTPPTCFHCGAPAHCVGDYEGRGHGDTYACDECCGHCQEDGRCDPIPEPVAAHQLRALTLYPEWAWASCHLGKDVENRPERVAKMVLNVVGDGWLAIHAGQAVGGRESERLAQTSMDAVRKAADAAGWVTLRLGGSIAISHIGEECAVLHRWITRSAIVALTRVGPGDPDSPWAVSGQAQIGLRDLFVLPEPVPCGGKQGLWTVPDDVAERVFAQVKPCP